MTRRLISLAAAAALAGAAACSGATGSAPPAAQGAARPAASGPVHFVQTAPGAPAPAGAPARTVAPAGASVQGVLTLDEAGCLRLGEGGPVLVWPAEAVLDLTEPGAVQVLDRATGAAVRVGESLALEVAPLPQTGVSLSRPLAPCTGLALNVGGFGPGRA